MVLEWDCLLARRPEKTIGLIKDHSIRNNYALPSLNRLSTMGLVKHGMIDAEISDYMSRLKVKGTRHVYLSITTLGRKSTESRLSQNGWGRNARYSFSMNPRGNRYQRKREIYRIYERVARAGGRDSHADFRLHRGVGK